MILPAAKKARNCKLLPSDIVNQAGINNATTDVIIIGNKYLIHDFFF
jgi:hypothetical protein